MSLPLSPDIFQLQTDEQLITSVTLSLKMYLLLTDDSKAKLKERASPVQTLPASLQVGRSKGFRDSMWKGYVL